MKIDAELNSENCSAAGETGGQSQVRQPSAASPLGSEAASPADAASGQGSLAAGAGNEGQAKAVIAQRVEPSGKAEEISLALATGRDNRVGDPSEAIASSDVGPADPLEDALAALDRRDYATAQRLFETLGRKDAAKAIEDALAALDRKDYATAQGLFEAIGQKSAAAAKARGLAPATPARAKPAASAGDRMASGSRGKTQQAPAISPTEVIPFVDAASRPLPRAEKAKTRGLKSLLLVAGLAMFAILGASALYGSPLHWTFAAVKSQALAGLASAASALEQPLEAIAGGSGREEERSAISNLSAALTQATVRLDRIEHDTGARLDKLSERVDQDSAKAAAPAATASELAAVVARLDKLEKRLAVAAAPASEPADVAARLDKLEKRAAVPAASSAKAPPPGAPKPSTLVARAEPSASNETARPDNPKSLLRDYSVETVQNGMALVDSRYGVQEVAPGDFIPGAGRVLRIERRGGDWVVLTSRGVISSGPPPD